MKTWQNKFEEISGYICNQLTNNALIYTHFVNLMNDGMYSAAMLVDYSKFEQEEFEEKQQLLKDKLLSRIFISLDRRNIAASYANLKIVMDCDDIDNTYLLYKLGGLKL